MIVHWIFNLYFLMASDVEHHCNAYLPSVYATLIQCLLEEVAERTRLLGQTHTGPGCLLPPLCLQCSLTPSSALQATLRSQP